MRILSTIVVAAVVLSPLTASATIINIPDDYPTIQEGVSHGSQGDTVLVQPGTYYENLNFNGHNVVLASLFLTAGDTTYISSTIIDGDSAASVVTFESGEDSTAQVVGFTVQRGYADSGGGIRCVSNSSPTISNNTIRYNSADVGGGILCQGNSHPRIVNNSVINNAAESYGAGIGCTLSSEPTIYNNTISGNSASWNGGAIFCEDNCAATISSNTIYANYSGWSGGGIHLSASNPKVNDNNISGNFSGFYGGGICCERCLGPVIDSNIIYSNYSDGDGGGIYCEESSPTITNNSINNNWAFYGSGGGIHCLSHSDPVISADSITENWAYEYGGGICCRDNCSPSISGSIVSRNYAGQYGGGIQCYHECSPTIEGNIVSHNVVDYRGGAVCCYYLSNALLGNNTISCNSATDEGGGIYCGFSDPRITSTILWGDTISNSTEIYVESGNPTVTYCDVQGGWPGQGNMDADPIFVGAEREDFHLRWRSPCIDAGSPALFDPDGTRSDVGALYFDQAVSGIIELYPYDTPILIPPEGGDILYDGWVFNLLGPSGRADVWTFGFVPGLGRYGPVDLYRNFRIPPDSIGMNDIRQNIAGLAPQGDYTLVAYVGSYPSTIIDSSYFYFSKEGSVAGEIGDWSSSGLLMKAGDETALNLPSHYALSQNYPNPFNASTVIEYQLLQASDVKLEVYNLFGQKVVTLVDERQEAGYKSVAWDAVEVSSGIYFYRLAAGDFTETQRMMLVK